MYKLAKRCHTDWIKEKQKIKNAIPKLKEMRQRLDPQYVVEKTENPTVHHIH